MNTTIKCLIFLLVISIPFVFAGNLLPKTTDVTFDNITKQRTYLVYLPTNYDPNTLYPVVFMFHGMGGNAQAAADSYGWQELADQEGFIVVFPDSLKDLPPKDFVLGPISIPGYDVTGFSGSQTYIRWDIAHLQADDRYTSQDIEFVKNIMNELTSTYKVSENHIFFTGHSYGALFAYYASVAIPDNVTAFAEHSGGVVKYCYVIFCYYFPIEPRNANLDPAYEVPGLLIHGKNDETVSYSWSKTLQSELTAHGYANQLIDSDAGGHNWDKSKNILQWQWFMVHSLPLVQPSCYSDAECGSDGFIGQASCNNEDVFQQYNTFTCNNAGTVNAACSELISNKLVTDCSAKELCENAECKSVVCFDDSDCGTTEYVDLFCSGDSVFQNMKKYSCSNPGTLQASCTSTLVSELKQTCEVGCYDGSCFKPACTEDSDCGKNQFFNYAYCKDGGVYKNYATYVCKNPGSFNSVCSSSVTKNLIQKCNYGCLHAMCLPKIVKRVYPVIKPYQR
ncbi:MAG: alpha/beta hydrolase-fold protein [Candidatus Micrarchaeota archaeon]